MEILWLPVVQPKTFQKDEVVFVSTESRSDRPVCGNLLGFLLQEGLGGHFGLGPFMTDELNIQALSGDNCPSTPSHNPRTSGNEVTPEGSSGDWFIAKWTIDLLSRQDLTPTTRTPRDSQDCRPPMPCQTLIKGTRSDSRYDFGVWEGRLDGGGISHIGRIVCLKCRIPPIGVFCQGVPSLVPSKSLIALGIFLGPKTVQSGVIQSIAGFGWELIGIVWGKWCFVKFFRNSFHFLEIPGMTIAPIARYAGPASDRPIPV